MSVTPILSVLFASVASPIASGGDSPSSAEVDLENLLAAVTIGAASRCYYVISPSNAKKLAVRRNADGVRLYPNFGLNGGEVLPGLTGLISDQLPSGVVLLIDATGLVGNTDAPVVRSYREGDVQLSTTPDSPETASTILVNMFQHGLRALLIERTYGFAVVRSGAVGALTGVAY